MLFNTLVWLGRLFMASVFLIAVVIAIPIAGLFEVLDRAARLRSERAPTQFID